MNNLSKLYIQHQNTLREGLLTALYAFFIVMCIWGATEFVEWVGRLQVENQTLRIERHEEKTAFKMMFMQDAMDKKQADKARAEYVKKWQKENPKLAGIFNAR